MSFYVNLADKSSQLVTLSSFFNRLSVIEDGEENEGNKQTLQKYNQLIEEGKIKELLLLLCQSQHLIWEHCEDKVIETCWSTFCLLSKELENEDINEIIERISESAMSSNESKTQLRLKILTNLYNFYPATSNERFGMFKRILSYCLESKQESKITPQFSNIDLWLNEWNASQEQRKEIYKLMYSVSKNEKGTSKEGLGILEKYLSCIDEENLAGSLEYAIDSAITAIKISDLYSCDNLLKSPAINQLQNSNEHKLLYKLLSLFASEKLDAFITFHEENPSFLQDNGLDYDECYTKMRLLSLSSLAVEQNEIKYSTICETLRVEEDDVEEWIVNAISLGLIEAKIDELEKVILIKESKQRVFNQDQWKDIQNKILNWTNHIDSLKKVVNESQMSSQ